MPGAPSINDLAVGQDPETLVDLPGMPRYMVLGRQVLRAAFVDLHGSRNQLVFAFGLLESKARSSWRDNQPAMLF